MAFAISLYIWYNYKERSTLITPLIIYKGDDYMEKMCKVCGEKKKIEEFRALNEKCRLNICRKCENERNKKYNLEHKDGRKKISKKYYEKHKEIILKKNAKRKKNRKKEDCVYKLKEQIRRRIWGAFNSRGYKKNKHTEEILGCTLDYFYNYLLQTYKDNYGYEWDGIEPVHIDHINPICNAKTEEEVYIYNKFNNMQLLKAEHNLEKSSKTNWKIIIE